MSLFKRRTFHRLASLLLKDTKMSDKNDVSENDVETAETDQQGSVVDQAPPAENANAPAVEPSDPTNRNIEVAASDAESSIEATDIDESTAVESEELTSESEQSESDSVGTPEPVLTQPETTLVQEEEPKKKGLGPRWSYIIVRGSIVACIWAFFTYGFDPLLHYGFVSSAESAAGAKVDIGDLTTKLFPPSIRITQLAVANQDSPDSNLFEFAELHGRVSGTGLLKGKYIIEQATITGLRWDTERKTSGKFESTDEPDASEDQGPGLAEKAKNAGKKWAAELLDRVKLDYDPNNYESVRLATRFESEWKTDFDDLETRVRRVDGQYKRLRDLIKNAKGKPLERIRAYDQVRVQGVKLLRDINTMKVELANLPTKARNDLGRLNAARQRDTAEIQSKVKNLFDGNGDDLSEFLLGPELHHRVQRGLSWFNWADGRVDEFQSRPKPKRFRGEDIHFETLEPLPKYLVRLINVTGSGVIGDDQLAIEGTIRDVTSDPVLHGKPIVMRFEGKGEGILHVKSTFDRTIADSPSNQFEFDYALPRVIEQELGDSDSLKVTVTADHTRWHGTIMTRGAEIRGTISMVQTPVVLTADLNTDIDERLRNIVSTSVSKIRRIDAIVRISGTIQNPKLKLETNLGKAISAGVKEGLQDQLATEKEALIAKLNASFGEKQKKLISLFNARQTRVSDALKSEEVGVQSLIPRIGAKGFDASRLFK
jgi:uncharacterized protein (TIGR03545 family)